LISFTEEKFVFIDSKGEVAAASLLSSVILPVIVREQNNPKNEKIKETLAQLSATLNTLENKSPTIIKDLVVGILHRLDKYEKHENQSQREMRKKRGVESLNDCG
jgi:hypothetical protein